MSAISIKWAQYTEREKLISARWLDGSWKISSAKQCDMWIKRVNWQWQMQDSAVTVKYFIKQSYDCNADHRDYTFWLILHTSICYIQSFVWNAFSLALCRFSNI